MSANVTTLGQLLAACAALLGAMACAATAALYDAYRLPPPDASLDPARLRVGEPLYACDRWSGQRPSDDRVLVDVFFGRRSADDPDDRPREESLQAVAQRRGDVLFVFPFPAARVWIATDSIPRLPGFAKTVPDPTRYDWGVAVGLSHPPTSADSTRFVDLGGRVTHMLANITTILGYLPSRSLPALRGAEGVTFVEASGLACLA